MACVQKRYKLPFIIFFNSRESLPNVTLFQHNIPIWILFCYESVTGGASFILHCIRISSGKGCQLMSVLTKIGETLNKTNWLLSSRPTCLRSHIQQALTSLFFFIQHSRQHTTLSGKSVYDSTRQALFSHCLCLMGSIISSQKQVKTNKKSKLLADL